MHILVTGATGYIGGRLVPRLLEQGHRVRVLVRDSRRLEGREWRERVETVEGDLTDGTGLDRALEGIDAAYYLVHSMGGIADFAELDRRAANNFCAAAERVRHVIYLGGLLPEGSDRSKHLGSRGEVGEILRSRLPVTEFRAGPIIGSGSASFEMVRYLTERLPVMVAPRWIGNRVQPIAVRDTLAYLVGALDREPLGVVEIGADRLTFREMMKLYADVRGLRRWIVPVPVLAPRLAALWVGLVTPISNRLAVPLIEGIVAPVVADTTSANEHFPEIEPLSCRTAVTLALRRIEEGMVETRWSGALGAAPAYELADREGMITEVVTVETDASPESVFRSFSSLGGKRGWLAWNWAWTLRGLLDSLVGGPGIRRGRRHPTELLPGEAVDFWRVEQVVPGRLLRLRAEMKVPGRAWLQWEVERTGGTTRLVQTALFAPKGLWGVLYWYSLLPVHSFIFGGLARKIAEDGRGY